MLLISVQDAEGRLLYTSYFTGSYLDYKFLPENSGILVHGGYFYAPQIMRDAQGRYLMWGWLKEGRNKQAMMEAGWAGVMSLPILVSLESDGELKLEPVPELAGLRKQHWCYNNLEITSQDTSQILKEVAGNCLEIIAEFESDQINPFEFKFRCSPNVEEQTRLIYQPTKQQFVLERTQSSLNTKVDQFPSMVPVKIAPGEKLKLHIFLDHSVLEMFVNNRTCLASRIYPGRSDSLGLELVSLEGVYPFTGYLKLR
jgi:beta-fructofuranosidase